MPTEKQQQFPHRWLCDQLARARVITRGCGIVTHEPGWTYPHEPFTDYDIHYVFEGGAHYEYPDAEYETSPGKLFFMAPGVEFMEKDRVANQGVRMLACHFSLSVSDGVDPLQLLKLPVVLESPDRETTDLMARELIIASRDLHAGNRWAIFGVQRRLMELLVYWIQHALKHDLLSLRDEKLGPDWMEAVLSLMDIRLDDPELGVPEMADHASLSPSHFAHQFTRYAGLPPKQLLLNKRMEKACALLVNEPSLTVKEIGGACGFKDPYHFSAQFKKVHEVSPSLWREQQLALDH